MNGPFVLAVWKSKSVRTLHPRFIVVPACIRVDLVASHDETVGPRELLQLRGRPVPSGQ